MLKKIPVSTRSKKDQSVGMFGKNGVPFNYPSFSVTDKQMPEVDSWPVEGRYRLMIDVVITSKDSARHQPTRAGFDIVGYKVMPQPKTMTEMSDKEFGEYQDKVLSKRS